jgi:uncharacterized protein YbjT (DUF2867 family)
VTVLTRDAAKASSLPAGARAVTGDLLDPSAVRSVFKGMDSVFLLNTVSPTEGHEGLMGVNGAMLADVKRIVYVSVQDADKAAYLPHFGAKLPVELAIKASGIPFTILRPNNFFQNDHWLKEGILQYGVYPQPIGAVGLSRVDVRDIGEAAAVALTSAGHDGQTYNLVGPAVWTGTATAEIWSKALGKPIRYAGDDLDPWEQQSLQFMPASLVFDFRRMFEFFQARGLKATSEDVARQTKLIGHAPRRYEDFVAETVAAWQA